MTSWPNSQNSTLFLAPMEGVTDYPMRALFSGSIPGFSHFVTEFLRVSQMPLPEKAIRRHMKETKAGSLSSSGAPVILQLLGGDPMRLAQTAANAVLAGAIAIDLNFGCPAPTVNKNDGGATLLKHPKRILAIVKAVREAIPPQIPVSAKLRLGWDDPEAIHENSQMAADGGATWITIHGRTKMQGYIPPAFWKPIRQVREALSIPVIANGEIWTLDDFKKCREESRCSHFMIGRGALANPHLAASIALELGILKEKILLKPSAGEWNQYLNDFLSICEKESTNELYGVKRTKQWLRYVHLKNEFPDFHRVKKLESSEEIRKILPTIEFPH